MTEKDRPRLVSWSNADFVPRFEYGHMADIKEVTGSAQGTRLGTGFTRFTDAQIPWITQYDEVLLVLEGEMSVKISGKVLTAGPQDCIWLPAGSDLIYAAKSALVFYAIEPADWAEGAT